MKFEFEVTWQDLAFIWCAFFWAALLVSILSQQFVLPFNQGLLYIYGITAVASIPGMPAYLVWKWRKKKRAEEQPKA